MMNSRMTTDDRFSNGGMLQDFWQWACSDLLSNTLRGILAEFLVAKALGVADGVRKEWDAVDVTAPNGTHVEVKSAAYVQSWQQAKPSTISFDIAKKRSWRAESTTYDDQLKRSADVYVFALLTEKDRAKVDPLDLTQWTFHVLATAVLNTKVGDQKTISLAPLLKLNPTVTGFDGLRGAIMQQLRTDSYEE
jgi:hypothetical protein